MAVDQKIVEAAYTEWRRNLDDPTSVPSWGNVRDADIRRAWTAAIEAAQTMIALQFLESSTSDV